VLDFWQSRLDLVQTIVDVVVWDSDDVRRFAAAGRFGWFLLLPFFQSKGCVFNQQIHKEVAPERIAELFV
jgi:hypothetical protein